MFCKNCGKKLDDKAKFCDSCGTAVTGDTKDKAVLNNSTITKAKKFNFGIIYAYITSGILVFLAVFFSFLGSYEDGFWGPFIGIIILSVLLGILVTFIVKWCKKGFAYEDVSEDLSEEEISRYKGLGGWLILVIIGLFVTVLWYIYHIYEGITFFKDGIVEIFSNPASEMYFPGYASLLKFELIVGTLFLASAVYLIFLFFKRSKNFPKYYVLLLITSVVYLVLDYVIFFSLTVPSDEMKQIFDEALSEQIIEIGRSVVPAIIWGLYMVKSKRVKATFVEK